MVSINGIRHRRLQASFCEESRSLGWKRPFLGALPRDRRSGSSNSYLTLCAPLHWERRSLYAIDRYLLGTERERRTLQHTRTRGNRPFGTTSETANYAGIAEGPSPNPSYSCGNGIAILRVHAIVILFLAFFLPPPSPKNWVHEFSRGTLVLANLFRWDIISACGPVLFSRRATARMCYLCSCLNRTLRKYFFPSNYTDQNIISFNVSSTQNYFANLYSKII